MQNRDIYSDEHELFRSMVRRFFEQELECKIESWEAVGNIPREFWVKAADIGMLGCGIPEEYGGPGADFYYNMIVAEEVGYANGGASLGFSVHADMVAYYLLHHASPELKGKWLPKMVSAAAIAALGMSEPGAGSDVRSIATRAIREGDHYVINGQKTFITNGQNCDFVLLACKTGSSEEKGNISMILVETDRAGFERGRRLKKIGMKAADTSELYFTDVRVPVSNRVGAEGGGFPIMMQELPRERLTIAVRALAEAQRAFDLSVAYATDRKVFGKRVLDFQNTRFCLAEVKTELAVGWAYIDQCIIRMVRGVLGPEEGAMAKLWTTETGARVIDKCLQLFGGYGYISEYPISRLYVDSRARRIVGGTSEIMKLVIGRSISDPGDR